MASRREGPLKIHLVHGAKHHFLTLALGPDDISDVISLDHLAVKAAEVTGIPPDRQKLICKGKTLIGGVGDRLRKMGVKDGAKVMLLGSKPSSPSDSGTASPPIPAAAQRQQQARDPYSEDLGKLNDCEARLSQEADAVSGIIRDLNTASMDSGEDSPQDSQQLEQVKKSLLRSGERLMRLLESLDGLRFDTADTDSRAKRKAMVNQIQKLMDQSEEVSSSIKRKLAAKQ